MQDVSTRRSLSTEEYRFSLRGKTMAAVTLVLCIFGLGALLSGRVSADEHCSSCQVSW